MCLVGDRDCNWDFGGLYDENFGRNSAEILQKLFRFLFDLSMFLQKLLISAKIACFGRRVLSMCLNFMSKLC